MKLEITDDGGNVLYKIARVNTDDSEEAMRSIVLYAIDRLIENEKLYPEDLLVALGPHFKNRLKKLRYTDRKYKRYGAK